MNVCKNETEVFVMVTPKMRTRILSQMANCEVEEYLERNDIIFIPVGVTEMHGALPMDCEYVMAEAYARLFAEKVDGLCCPICCISPPAARSAAEAPCT